MFHIHTPQSRNNSRPVSQYRLKASRRRKIEWKYHFLECPNQNAQKSDESRKLGNTFRSVLQTERDQFKWFQCDVLSSILSYSFAMTWSESGWYLKRNKFKCECNKIYFTIQSVELISRKTRNHIISILPTTLFFSVFRAYVCCLFVVVLCAYLANSVVCTNKNNDVKSISCARQHLWHTEWCKIMVWNFAFLPNYFIS